MQYCDVAYRDLYRVLRRYVAFGLLSDRRLLRGHCAKLYRLRIDDAFSLRYADLRHADLSWTDFSGIDFSRSDLSHASFKASHLLGVKFRNAKLQFADFRHTSFNDSDVRNADLRSANFDGAFFLGVDLRGADIRYSPDDLHRHLQSADIVWTHVQTEIERCEVTFSDVYGVQ